LITYKYYSYICSLYVIKFVSDLR